MPRTSLRFLLLMLSIMQIGGLSGLSNAQTCPADVIRGGETRDNPPAASYTVPALDSSFSRCYDSDHPPCDGAPPPESTFGMSYDWRTGTFAVRMFLNYIYSGFANLSATDEFVVHGMSGPSTIRARLRIQGRLNGAFDVVSSFHADLHSTVGPAVGDDRVCSTAPCELDMLLETSLFAYPDVPFTLGLVLDLRGGCIGCFNYGGGSYGTARLSFADLPPGASIRSCKGFPDDATPTRHLTWGRLKRFYR